MVLALVGSVSWWGMHLLEAASAPPVRSEPPKNLPPYQSALAGVEERRARLAEQYAEAGGAERRKVLERARTEMVEEIHLQIMPHWFGTPWDFNGTSTVPGQGQIACGYFVSTVLRDAGLKVDRIRLAQQPSTRIIGSLTKKAHVDRLIGVGFDVFQQRLEDRGPGLFLVGLDRHVGFIVQTEREAWFVHSDGGRNQCVVKEAVASADLLRRSNWRVLAKISEDDRLVSGWLSGRKFETQTRG